MGYYMRYIIAEDKAIDLGQIEHGLKQADPNYSIVNEGDLKMGEDIYGVVDVTLPGDGLFEEELEELKEEIQETAGRNRKKVLETLNNATAIVAVQVLYQGQTEENLNKIDPLWEWLFRNYKGLLQADAEGYYDQDKQILRT